METRHLKLIKAIVEEGSLTRAIDKLHLSQSALSHQLREAESQLGTRVFSRQNKKLILTQAGEKLYQLAVEVLQKMEETEKEIRQMVNGEIGEIRISTECYSSYHWLPSVLRQFHTLYPNVELRIVTEATHFPLQKLLEHELDIAIVSDCVQDKHLKYIELFRDEMMMLVSAEHPWADKQYVLAEDFVQEHLIIHSYPLESVSVHQYFLAPAGVSPKKITSMPLTEASLEMVKANMGVMSMAQWALRPYLKDSLKAVRIGKRGLKRKHFVALHQQKEQPPYFQHFIEFLKTEINLQWSM